MRPGSRGMRPGTGNRGMMVSSSGRPGTQSRLGTGQKPGTPGQTAGGGVSLNTQVNVKDRPVTQQGMMGMRVATAGPGRQVQDASYFSGRLHQKIADIQKELDSLQDEVDREQKDKAQYAQLERKYETSMKEVRELEGQLADYNLATDNHRSSTNPEDIDQVCEQLQNRNKKDAEEVDQLFMIRQEKESGVMQLEHEIHSIQKRQENLINELAPHQLEQYQALINENNQLEGSLGPVIQELDRVTQMIHQKEESLAGDRWRDQFQKLDRQCQRLSQERDLAQSDAKTMRMNPEDARASMLNRVKEGKARMNNIEQQLQEISTENEQLVKAISELENDLKDRQSENGGNKKYEMLFQRDQEMTAFIDAFDGKQQAELRQQQQLQNMIVAILEHTSLTMQASGVEQDSKLLDIQEDLSFKERQLESSQSTKDRLEKELVKRQGELDKINTLDDKIRMELGALTTKMGTMQTDLVEFQNIDQLKHTAENTRQHLIKLKQQYIRRRDAIKQQVLQLSQELEKKKNRLATNNTAKTLDSLEQKLRHYEQNIFSLKQFIDAKNREINYGPTKKECMRLVKDINDALVQLQSGKGMTVGSY